MMTIASLKPEAIHQYWDDENARQNLILFNDLALKYRDDSNMRSRFDSGEVEEGLAVLGMELPSDMEARIVANTPETHYFVLPPDPNVMLADEDLTLIAGGKSAGSAGSAGTASSMGCSTVASSVSSAGSASTAGTAS